MSDSFTASDLVQFVRAMVVQRFHACYCSHGNTVFDDNGVDDVSQEVLLSVLSRMQTRPLTVPEIKSLAWLTTKTAFANWARDKASADVCCDTLDSHESAEHESADFPQWVYRVLQDDSSLLSTAVALSRSETKADAAELLAISRTSLFKRIRELKKRLALFDPSRDQTESRDPQLARVCALSTYCVESKV